jgi:hypothetical protein
MGRTRLAVHFGPSFSGDLWVWQLNLGEAASGRVGVVWETSTFDPSAKREHRFRARTLPDWWPELSSALARVQFSVLPPFDQLVDRRRRRRDIFRRTSARRSRV